MTNTVAHPTPKPGTSRRLGLRLPAPKRFRTRIGGRTLIVGPASVWTAPTRTDESGRAWHGCPVMPGALPVTPIHFTNVTASRGGEPVHVSEVIKDLMTNMGLIPRERVNTAVDGTVECCDIAHTWSESASSWLPGCAHLGAV